MRKYKKVLKKDLADIICDICKESCIKFNNDPFCSEFATLDACWGYWSKKDGEKLNIDLCENCFDKVYNFITAISADPKQD